MRLTSMLMNSGTFGIVEWCIVGVLAVILVIAFFVGYKKGVSNLNLRPISWVFGCAAFLLLEAFLHDQCFINAIIPIEDPALASFIATLTWLVVALLARWIVFGFLSVGIRSSKAKKLKKAEELARKEKEAGEEEVPDENEKHEPLPTNGKIKLGLVNRLFGGLCSMINTALVLYMVLALVFLVLSLTPMYAELEVVYTGALAGVWDFIRLYTLDVLMVAIICAIIIKGYRNGALLGLTSLLVSLLKLGALVAGFYLPFSPMAAEGETLGFLSVGAKNLAALIPVPETIPPIVMESVFKVVFGIVLSILFVCLASLIGRLLDKLVDVVDNSPVLWRIDGFFGAVVYIAYAALAVSVIIVVLYILDFYGVLAVSQLFTENSPLLNGAYGVCDSLLKPLLEGAM